MEARRVFIILKVVLVLILAALIALVGLLFFAGLGDDYDFTENDYYVAKRIKYDGEKFDGNEIATKFNLGDKSESMSLYLKDTGDCGIVMWGKGELATWKDDTDTVLLKRQTEQTTLIKGLGILIYKGYYQGKELTIELEKVKKATKWFKENPQYMYSIKFSKNQTSALSNFMLGGAYCRSGNIMYGKMFEFVKNRGSSSLGSFSIDGQKSKILYKNGQAKYLSKYGEYIYFKWLPNDNSIESICRLNTENSKVEVLREGVCDYVQVRFGKIYFTDSDARLCRMTITGQKENVVIDKSVYMPYVVDRNWVIFQDDADGEKLHLATLDGTYDRAITDKRSYCWTISGRTLYYSGVDNKKDTIKHKCKLYKMPIGNLNMIEENETETGNGVMGDLFAINSYSLYGIDGTETSMEDWQAYKNDIYKGKYYENTLMYIDDIYKIAGKVNKNFEFVDITMIELNNDNSICLLNDN